MTFTVMTKDEFLSKESACRRHQSRLVLFWFAGFSVFLVWPYLATGKIDRHWTSLAWQICFMAYLAGGFFGVLWFSTRQMNQLGMVCPKCKWGKFFLFNAVVKKRILATGKCKCGQEIIESHDAA